ncbi:MAG: galactose oxidase [Bacteroidota bacterium]
MRAGNIVAVIFMSMLNMPLIPAGQNDVAEAIEWSNGASLPAAKATEKQLGLAGVFAGVNNNVLLIAGGSNFPGLKPWEGGKKVHYNTIYILTKNSRNEFTWLSSKTQLKNKIAYGASTTITNGIICAGGETENANSSRNTFLMQWDAASKEVVFHDLPLLPIPLANASMTAIGKKVYLVGGESDGKPSAKVFILDLWAHHLQWQSLPDLPIALSHSVAVAQTNGKHPCVYVIGGRSSTPSGISQLHNTVFCFDPEQQKWTGLAPISDGSHITNLSAGTGVPFGDHEILLAGGDNGTIFHQIETYNADIAKATTDEEKQKLQAEKLDLITHHQGFSRDMLLYNTLTNSWKKVGELPFLTHVTTTAVIWDKDIYIPGGEIKPGIRTPDVVRGRYIHHIK